jgi:hypothetical protein
MESEYMDIKTEELENEMEESPWNIELGLSLLERYKSINNREKYRELRYKIHEYFVLPEYVWLLWIEEIK